MYRAGACFEQSPRQVSCCCLLDNFQVVCYHLAARGLLLRIIFPPVLKYV